MNVVIREMKMNDRLSIFGIEYRVDGWNKQRVLDEMKPKERLALVAVHKKTVLAWCLYEVLHQEISIVRLVEDPLADSTWKIVDGFLSKLVKKLYTSRRKRVTVIIREDLLRTLCHLRDSSYDEWDDLDSGFRAVNTHRNAFSVEDKYLDGVEMVYVKRKMATV